MAECPPSSEPHVYVVECEHIRDDDALEEPPFRGMALLVSIGGSEADRLALQPIRHALLFARCALIGGAGWPERLAEHAAAVRPQFATVVLHVGAPADVVLETDCLPKIVQAIVDALREQLSDALATVVVVSESSADLTAVRGVSGFMAGCGATTAETARQTFIALTALLAPRALEGIDLVDLLLVLGTADAPTMVAHAVWMRAGDGQLTFASDADGQAFARARRIVAVPFVDGCGWGELSRLRKALRRTNSEALSVITWATAGALAPGVLPSSVGLLLLFCL